VSGSAARVTLAVCTRERPAELRALLSSIGRSRFRRSPRPDVQVVVVENGPFRSGLDGDEESERCGWPVRIVHEPRPGVAFARNAAIAARRPDGDWFISVDDDQTVAPSWLDHHLAYAASSSAAVCTGPVLVKIPDGAPPWASALWRNIPRHETGTVVPSFLGGNVCFRSSLFDELETWYDERFATATADDTDLGRRLTAAGHRIEWNDRAVAWENVHPARLRLRWFVERYLSYGGFEAIHARSTGGWRALARDAPAETVRLARGIAAAVGGIRGDADAQAAAIAHTAQAVGWFGGIAGWRVRDYRTVTSAS
jgi:GT2 family glycosyltransferase